MYKNMDYKNTYCAPHYANVRYPSDAAASIDGWAYVFTQDEDYVRDLSVNHNVEVQFRSQWEVFSGNLPSAGEMNAEPETSPDEDDDGTHDPNY